MNIACNIRCDRTFEQVRDVLARAGFACERFPNENTLLRALRQQSFKLILVDAADAAANDEELYSWMNCRTGESTPVVMLSTAYDAANVARALEAGADYCIHHPVELGEMPARFNAILRRYDRKTSARSTIEMLGFRLDRDLGILLDRGVPVDLTPREFTLAWLFFSSPGTFFSRDTISMAIWGVDSEITNRTIEQHIYKLRKKLNLCTERGASIRTAYTKGYCLQLNEVPAEAQAA
jgi:DNA-binding response OmpR family regulator